VEHEITPEPSDAERAAIAAALAEPPSPPAPWRDEEEPAEP
jgi:hypothetical protein